MTTATQDNALYPIDVRHYFINEYKFTRSVQVRGWRDVAIHLDRSAPKSLGWGRELVMTSEIAEAIGAYETKSGQWVLSAVDDVARTAIEEMVTIAPDDDFADIAGESR